MADVLDEQVSASAIPLKIIGTMGSLSKAAAEIGATNLGGAAKDSPREPVRPTRSSTSVETTNCTESIERVQMTPPSDSRSGASTPSDVLGAITVIRTGKFVQYRLKWQYPELPTSGNRRIFTGAERLLTLWKVDDGKERKVGEATTTCDWHEEPHDAIISTWKVPIELGGNFSWLDSYVFLASIFEACRITHVQGAAAAARGLKIKLPELDSITPFTLKFDVRTEGALYKDSTSKHLKKLREWVGNTPYSFFNKTAGPNPNMGWHIDSADTAWKTNLLGFFPRPPEKQSPSQITFGKVDASSGMAVSLAF